MSLQLHAVFLAIGGLVRAAAEEFKQCPGNLNVGGFGVTSIVPTGWATPDEFVGLQVSGNGNEVAPVLGSRAYFALSCNAGVYDPKQYLAFNLLGRRMRYTTDMSELGCGCNAAFYLTNMHQNTEPSECSDFYCDANNVCGCSCAEIDIQEGNKFSWHSTLHGKVDHGGLGAGIGGGGASWNGPRDWSTSEYGPGASCIDTTKPFEVEVGFPADASCQLMSMDIKLSQAARGDCTLKLSVAGYNGMLEMTQALKAGMTPIVSYWKSADMLWMDGKGADGQGPCATDSPDECGKVAKFSNFSVETIPGNPCMHVLTDQQPSAPPPVPPQLGSTSTAAAAAATTTAVSLEETSGEGSGGSDLLLQAMGPIGFLSGAGFASLVFVVLGYVRSRQTQQMPERPEIRTLQHSLSSSNNLMSQASIVEQREAEQA